MSINYQKRKNKASAQRLLLRQVLYAVGQRVKNFIACKNDYTWNPALAKILNSFQLMKEKNGITVGGYFQSSLKKKK